MSDTKRIHWLDGIKGIACVLVFFHHFLVGFYPAAYYGEKAGTHLWRFPKLEVALSQSPFTVFLTGHFLVCLFCVISGVVLSLKVMRSSSKSKTAADMIVKRYFRLAFPIFFIQLFIFIIGHLGLFFSNRLGPEVVGSNWLSKYFNTPMTIKQLFVNSFIQVEFTGKSLMSVTWMISELFLGGILSIALSMLITKGHKSAIAICGIWAFGLLFKNNLYASFALGTLVALYLIQTDTKKKCTAVTVFLAVGGLILGGYPTDVQPTNFYRFLLKLVPSSTTGALLWHQIGAALLLVAIGNSQRLQAVFSKGPVLFLGKISFAVYLVHFPILHSFSAWMFLKLFENGLSYNGAAFAVLIASLFVVIICAYVFYRVIERLSDRISDIIVGIIAKLDEPLPPKVS